MGGLDQLADDADAGEGGWGVLRENADAIPEQTSSLIEKRKCV